MRFSSVFINRPVLGIVCNLLIIIAGAISFNNLGVRDYPAVDPPIITVSTTYAGASADVVESKITEPLEEGINGIAGIRTLTSTSANGSSNITVEFNVGADLEAAANDVRDKVSRAMRNLPADADNPIVTKSDANASPILFATVQSDQRSPLEITDYANNVLKEKLQTITDVSEVRIWGEKRFAIRLWMDPLRMAAYGITPQDIKLVLDRENVELPAGRIEGHSTELAIQSMSSLQTIDDFSNLIIKTTDKGAIRFRDIGEAIEGAENERTIMKRDGVPMVGVALIPQAGANHIAIADEFYKRLSSIRKDLPSDIKIEIGFDTTKNIKKSIVEVFETILLAFILVVLVIFIFLRNWRATLIPVLAIPISLIGSFFIMSISGFSINILTLLGIVLATGLVVDDAIVVLENIYVKIEQGIKPIDAGHRGTTEIFFAVIATSLALFAVLLPIILMPGMTGRLFREFGVVVAGSILISTFVSLTITPMMCTRLLHPHATKDHSLYTKTEPFFRYIIEKYRLSLISFMKHRHYAFLIIGVATVLIVLFGNLIPSELAPLEDRSRVNMSVSGPEGASFEYMTNYMDNLTDLVDSTIKEAEVKIVMTPSGGGGAGAVNSGFFRLMLNEPDKRKRSQMQIVEALTKEASSLAGARVIVSQEPTIGDRRSGLQMQFVIMSSDLEKLRSVIPQFLQALAQDTLFSTSDINLKFNKPELQMIIERDKVRESGLYALDIAQTVQLAYSGNRYGYFERDGKQYPIIGQFYRDNRSKPDDLLMTYVKNKNNELIPLSNFISYKETSNPPQVYHYDRNVSATISAGLAPGVALGDAITEIRKISKEILDESYSTALSGQARDFVESSSNSWFALAFALLLIYLVLAAQFESFRHPFTVMLTVPLALAGAFLSLWYFNQTFNIFSQIGIIVLIGLVTKNGILIVEFANQRRQAGMDVLDAVIDASVSRLRPILMTSLTVILGVLPIALGLGAGAKSRVSMGIADIGGVLFSLVLSLYVIPAMYSYIAPRKTKN